MYTHTYTYTYTYTYIYLYLCLHLHLYPYILSISIHTVMLLEARVMNAPKRASDTSAAEPIAKPLPIAAVVLPAASVFVLLYQ